MQRLGPKTRELLKALGLDDWELENIEKGDLNWDLIPVDYSGSQSTDADLLLSLCEGGQRVPCRLSKSQADELINVWDFERRQSPNDHRPVTFPAGDFDDWTGIRPDSDWLDLVRGYRLAAALLTSAASNEAAAPYLYLCRHTLELQLKAIIMLGQQAMRLVLDLPGHHDLQKLWTAAYPIASARRPNGATQLAMIRRIIDDYNQADPGSYNFRYPVTKNNTPIVHKAFVHAFSQRTHASNMKEAFDYLDDIIRELRFSVLLRGLDDSV
jgi:hypothetical protein